MSDEATVPEVETIEGPHEQIEGMKQELVHVFHRMRDKPAEEELRIKALEFAILTERQTLRMKEDDAAGKPEPWEMALDVADKYLRFMKGLPEHDLEALFPELTQFQKELPERVHG